MDIYRAQKEAENLAVDINYPEKKRKKIYFEFTTLMGKPIKCVWLDPFLGLFGIAGQEDKGFTRISELDKLGAVEATRQWIE